MKVVWHIPGHHNEDITPSSHIPFLPMFSTLLCILEVFIVIWSNNVSTSNVENACLNRMWQLSLRTKICLKNISILSIRKRQFVLRLLAEWSEHFGRWSPDEWFAAFRPRPRRRRRSAYNWGPTVGLKEFKFCLNRNAKSFLAWYIEYYKVVHYFVQ